MKHDPMFEQPAIRREAEGELNPVTRWNQQKARWSRFWNGKADFSTINEDGTRPKAPLAARGRFAESISNLLKVKD